MTLNPELRGQAAYDEWAKEYEPIKYFDRDGEDYDLIKVIDNDHIWTESDESGAGTFIGAGFWNINALGYYVTKKPWTNEWESIITRECK